MATLDIAINNLTSLRDNAKKRIESYERDLKSYDPALGLTSENLLPPADIESNLMPNAKKELASFELALKVIAASEI